MMRLEKFIHDTQKKEEIILKLIKTRSMCTSFEYDTLEEIENLLLDNKCPLSHHCKLIIGITCNGFVMEYLKCANMRIILDELEEVIKVNEC